MSILSKEKLYEYKTINSKGNTIHLIKMKGDSHWKFHKWDGPAIIPHSVESEYKTPQYYINGIPYGKAEYLEIMRERSGLPWYKQASMKGTRL